MKSRATTSPAATRPHGFTLLELVLVMLLLCGIMAMVSVKLSGFRARSSARDAAAQFLTLTRWAEARSAADGRVYRLSVSVSDAAYWLAAQDGDVFVAIGTDFGQTFTLPEGMWVDVQPVNWGTGTGSAALDGSHAGVGTGASGEATIDFYPDGRRGAAAVRMGDARGRVTLIACGSPAEPYRMMTEAELEAIQL